MKTKAIAATLCAIITGPAAAPPAAAQAAQTAPATAQAPPVGLGIEGTGNHRRPVPGERQTARWVLRNLGTRPVERVWLRTAVPGDWRLVRAADCRVTGRRLLCVRGPLAAGERATVTVRMRVPRRPRLGPAGIAAATRFAVAGQVYEGPRAALRVTVVRRR